VDPRGRSPGRGYTNASTPGDAHPALTGFCTQSEEASYGERQI
jgi:hypothetical protein